jgi:predicted  nucleic acid-binding Zn-ribbon protein
LQLEIATAQGDLGAAEEKVIEQMVEADAIAGDVKQAEAALARDRKEVEAEKKALAEQLAAAERELAEASARRDRLVRDTPKALIDLFHQVAKVRKGIAIATATRDGLCSVCHVRLRPPVFQKVRQNEGIVQCETCQRILYFIPPPPPVEPPVVQS